ncbi:hypothetical protein AAY473_025273 [Plecturocebus cupreus]
MSMQSPRPDSSSALGTLNPHAYPSEVRLPPLIARCLSLSTFDAWSQMTPGCGAVCHCRGISSTPGAYTPDASSTAPSSCDSKK